MELEDRTTPEEEEVVEDPVENDEAPDTFLEQLREKRRRIATATDLKLEIPGFDGLLWAQYRRLEWDELKRIADKASKSKSPRKELLAHCDTLIAACEGILIQKDGKLEALNNAYPEFGDEPVVFDERLGAALGFEIDKTSPARSAVLKAFGGNGVAVTAQQVELVQWIESSRSDDDQDFSTS